MAVVLVACGGDAASPAPVTVLVVDGFGHPVAGVHVVARDEQGVRLGEQDTGADGSALLDVPPGGSITTHDVFNADVGNALINNWYSIVDVAPGDYLTVPLTRLAAAPRRVRILSPALRFFAACHDDYMLSATDAGLLIDERCPDHRTVVADGFDFKYQVTHDVDLGLQSVTLAGPWRADFVPLTYQARGVSPDVSTLDFTADLLVDGFPTLGYGRRVVVNSAADSFPRAVLGERGRLRMRHNANDRTWYTGRHVEWTQADLNQVMFDTATLPSPISPPTIGDHTVSWTGGDQQGQVRVRITAPTTADRQQSWFVIAPPGTQRLTFPTDEGMFWPTAEQGVFGFECIGVAHSWSSRWPAYDESKRHYDGDPVPVDADFTARYTSTSLHGCLP